MRRINLPDFSLEKISQWPLLTQSLLATLMACTLVFSAYGMMIQNKLRERRSLHQQQLQLMDDVAGKQQWSAMLPVYQQQLNALHTRLEQMVLPVAIDSYLPKFLQEIAVNANDYRVILEKIIPEKERVGRFYREMGITLVLKGSYRQLALFLSHLANSAQVSFHDFTINDSDGNKLHMMIRLKIYQGIRT